MKNFKMMFFIFWVLLVFNSGVMSMETHLHGSFGVNGDHGVNVSYTQLDEMFSQNNEGKIDFLKRVARKLISFSEKTGFEACGVIAQKLIMKDASDGVMHYGIIISTNESNIACVNENLTPNGFTATTDTIHSHGMTHSFRVNAVDVLLTNGALRINRNMGGRNQNQFSAQDEKEPGYLAAPIGLLYQNGQGVESKVTNYGS